MIDHYILDGHEPVPEPDFLKWARWIESCGKARIVAQTHLIDGSMVSTVFLGLDHAFGNDPPMLFETGLFSGERQWSELLQREVRDSDIVARYSTWAQAEAGHMEWVERCVPPDLVAVNAKHKKTEA